MEITAQRLRYILELLGTVAQKKGSLPILADALFRPGEAHASDLASHLRLAVPESDQTFLMPLRGVLAFIKTVPGYEPVHLTVEGERLKVAAAGQVAIFPIGKASEWPAGLAAELPNEPDGLGSVDGDLFVDGLTSVLRYCAADNSRPVLAGVLVEFGEKDTTFVAADGFRMGIATLPIPFVVPEGKVNKLVIDRSIVKALDTVWRAADKPPVSPPGATLRQITLARRLARLQFDAQRFYYLFGDVLFSGGLTPGTYPHWRQLVPKESTATLRVLSEELRQAIKPISGFGGTVKLQWSGNSLSVEASETDGSGFQTALAVRQEGRDGSAAYGLRYLEDYLTQVSGPVTMHLVDGQSPLVLSAPRYHTCVVMPIYAGKDGAAAEKSEGR